MEQTNMKEGLKSVAYASGIALSGLLHPASADNAIAQGLYADETCTLFNGDEINLGEIADGYQCIGSVVSRNDTVIDIIKVHKSLGERGLYFIERDSQGYERDRNFMKLSPPNYTLPAVLKVHDYRGESYTVPLTNGGYMYEPTPTPIPSATSTHVPTITPLPSPTERKVVYAAPLPSKAPVFAPIAQPTPTEFVYEQPAIKSPPSEYYQPVIQPEVIPAIEPEIQEQTFEAPEQYEAPEQAEGPQCIDSWGNPVPLGVDRPTDSCISISPNVPNVGDTTYTYQSKPDSQGNKSIVEVVVTADGKRYWNAPEREVQLVSQAESVQQPASSSEDSNSIHALVQKAQNAFSKIRGMLTLRDSKPVVKALEKPQTPKTSAEDAQHPHNDVAQEEVISSTFDYPTLEELPKKVLYPNTYEWYNTVLPIAKDLGYDPRAHLVFIQIESGGVNGQTSEKNAQGLIQIIPDTWTVIRDTIIENPHLYEAALKNGIDPETMDVWDAKANIFGSGVYLMVYCRHPFGPIPTSRKELDMYVEQAAMAGIYYHDGPHAKDNYLREAAKEGIIYKDGEEPPLSLWVSPYGRDYRAIIQRLLPQIAQ